MERFLMKGELTVAGGTVDLAGVLETKGARIEPGVLGVGTLPEVGGVATLAQDGWDNFRGVLGVRLVMWS